MYPVTRSAYVSASMVANSVSHVPGAAHNDTAVILALTCDIPAMRPNSIDDFP